MHTAYISIPHVNNISLPIWMVCDGFSSFICNNETLPWDVVDGFSKGRSSLRYFKTLIQTPKVLRLELCLSMEFCC